MNKLRLLLASVALLCATFSFSAEAVAKPRPRAVKARIAGKPHTPRPNYSKYRGQGNHHRGLLAWLR